jgi:hypothetical protein
MIATTIASRRRPRFFAIDLVLRTKGGLRAGAELDELAEAFLILAAEIDEPLEPRRYLPLDVDKQLDLSTKPQPNALVGVNRKYGSPGGVDRSAAPQALSRLPSGGESSQPLDRDVIRTAAQQHVSARYVGHSYPLCELLPNLRRP